MSKELVSSVNNPLPLTSACAVFKIMNILKIKNEYEKIRKNSQRWEEDWVLK